MGRGERGKVKEERALTLHLSPNTFHLLVIIPAPMDTVTHGIAGSVFVRSLTQRHGARAALVLGMVAGMFPDVDFVFSFGERLEYLRSHRSWTHSFVLLPLLALGIALVARRFFRHARLEVLWSFAAVGLASHIVFDWITSFGTMFWTPLSRHRYALDWVFILDPIFTGIVSVSLFAAVIFRSRGRLLAGIGAAALSLYVLFCGFIHARALATWKAIDRPPAGAKVAALPQFLSPFRWLGLAEHENEIHAAFFDIGPFARGDGTLRPPQTFSEVWKSLGDGYPPPGLVRVRRWKKPPGSPALSAALALSEVRIYLDFARFPLASVERQPDGTTSVTLQDLRFLPWFTGPWDRRKGEARFRRQPFVYRVRLDASGRPIEQGFVHSSGSR
jgi:inner membrane protein